MRQRVVTLGYFDINKREYKHIPVTEQVEVLSLVGNLATGDHHDVKLTRTLWSALPPERRSGASARSP
jgi:predicted DNA-binding protein with PD1-like motif